MTTTQTPEAYTVTDACVRLGCISRKTFYGLINSGELKSFRIGSRRYVSAAAIAQFIERRESASLEKQVVGVTR